MYTKYSVSPAFQENPKPVPSKVNGDPKKERMKSTPILHAVIIID